MGRLDELITDEDLKALRIDQTRMKSQPDRRRRRVVQTVNRLKEADKFLQEFDEIMDRVCDIPGNATQRIGAFAHQLEILSVEVKEYKKKTSGSNTCVLRDVTSIR